MNLILYLQMIILKIKILNLKKNFMNNNEKNEKNILSINKNNIIKKQVKKNKCRFNSENGCWWWNIEILIQLFWENLIYKLLSRKDEKFISKVVEAINNIKELRKKDIEKKIKNKYIKTKNKKKNNKSDNFNV